LDPDSLLRTTTDGAEWNSGRSAELYAVASWSDGYFLVNDRGHVGAQPVRGSETQVDLFDVVRELGKRGIAFPALIRFQDVLKSRIDHLNEAFQLAIAEEGYRNAYEGVYPVKVNQLREVVEEILSAGERFGHGLECGSKSELMATLPYLADRDTLLLCNGAKDWDMVRLMLAGQRLGKRVRPILERQEEIELVLDAAREVDMTAVAGVRVRLSTRGAGLWSESGGENSKFGLSLSELIELVRRIREDHIAIRLDLLHFHLGSQIADLQTLRQAVEEAARVYVWLRQNGLEVAYFDVGGGLGVSYEAGNPKALGAINYELEDYARTVVQACGRIFDEAVVPHPILVSESGRAVTAHHSVLVVEAVGSRRKEVPALVARDGVEDPLLVEAYELHELASHGSDVPARAELERMFRRACSLHARMMARFRKGDMAVERKAQFERVYWAICWSIDVHLSAGDAAGMPESLAALEHVLVDHYQCNFSIFRSMVDHWAIGQRFPIMPLHRLDEKPTRRAVLVDLTCDSDGQVQRFVSPSGDKRHLELHDLRQGRPYYLGMFLMGAYQDIMGDMHNLFGRVTEVHVYADEAEPDNFYLEEILPGATVEQQLALVQYHANDLERRMGDLIREEVRAGRLRPREGVVLLNQYRQVFRDMTYLKTNGLE
jgi:arginine decarboxylase